MLRTQEESGAAEAAVRRAEADRLSLTERQHGAGVAQVVDTDSESEGESDDDDGDDCGGGNGGGGGGGGGGLGDAAAADEGDGGSPGGDDGGGSGRGGGRKRGGEAALATGAGPGEQAALESRVEEIQLQVRVLSRKKQDLEQVHCAAPLPSYHPMPLAAGYTYYGSTGHGSTDHDSTDHGRCTAACSSSAGV